MVANVGQLLTTEDLVAIPDDGNRYELIEGVLYVSTTPSLKHQYIIGNFIGEFNNYLRQTHIGDAWMSPGVIFSKYDSTIPDLIYISNERVNEIASGIHVEGAPDLIVEILSPGKENIARDREVKLRTHRKYGVKEYWIADPDNLTLEVYRGDNLTLVATLTIDDELTAPLLPGFSCKVREIFAQPSFA